MPFVEVSHADVEDALTGFSKLKQRVKRWQSKLLDSFAGGRKRSKSSAASSFHADAHTTLVLAHHIRAVGHNRLRHVYSSDDLSTHRANQVHRPLPSGHHALRSRAHLLYTAEERQLGRSTRRSLYAPCTHQCSPHGRYRLGSVRLTSNERFRIGDTQQSERITNILCASDTSAHFRGKASLMSHTQASSFSPMLPPPVLVGGVEHDTMKPPGFAAHRRASAQSSSSTGLRPDGGPEIPQRVSSDTHGAARRVSATSTSPSLPSSSPQLPSLHRMVSQPSLRRVTRNLSCCFAKALHRLGRKVFYPQHFADISRFWTTSLGDFLRGSWLMTGEDRHTEVRHDQAPAARNMLLPSCRPPAAPALPRTAGSIRSIASSNKPDAPGMPSLVPLSVDTLGAVQQAVHAPKRAHLRVLRCLVATANSAISGVPSLSTELLNEPVESPSKARTAFSAVSQPSSPLMDSDVVQPFAFDSLGRRRNIPVLDSVDLDNDDVDLELELSDDDLSTIFTAIRRMARCLSTLATAGPFEVMMAWMMVASFPPRGIQTQRLEWQ